MKGRGTPGDELRLSLRLLGSSSFWLFFFLFRARGGWRVGKDGEIGGRGRKA